MESGTILFLTSSLLTLALVILLVLVISRKRHSKKKVNSDIGKIKDQINGDFD